MPVNFEEVHHLTEVQEANAHAAAEALAQQAKSDLCVSCGATISLKHIDAYNHRLGWFLTDDVPLQWLSIHCDKCDYDTSLEKLGVYR